MKNLRSITTVAATFFQRCWLIGTVVAIAALVWVADEPAWAGPLQQFTVPTATPQSFEPDEELVPTATPVSIFESDDSDEPDEFDSNSSFDQPDEEPTPEPFIFDNEPEPDAVEVPADDLFDNLNTDDSSSDSSNNTNTQSENNSVLTDDNFDNTVPDITFNPLEDQTDFDNFDELNSTDNLSGNPIVGGGVSAGTSNLDTTDSDTVDLDTVDLDTVDLDTTGLDTTDLDTTDANMDMSDFSSSVGSGANSGVVSISVLNMRRDPKPDSDIIDTLWRNDAVEITQTANNGTWLLVCCGVELGSAGWVSSLYVDYDSSNLSVGSLSTTAGSSTTGSNTTGSSTTGSSTTGSTTTGSSTTGNSSSAVAAAASATTTESAVTEAGSATTLELTMTVTDTTVQAGEILDIVYTVENIGDIAAENVSLSNELPKALYLNNFEMDASGQFTHTVNAQNNQRILNMLWSEIDASETVTATITIQIATDAPNGLVIDNLAGVGADNSTGDTAALSIGTPPIEPPSFRRR